MMHKASPFTASCNGLIDLAEDDAAAEAAGTVFGGLNSMQGIVTWVDAPEDEEEKPERDDDEDEEEEEVEEVEEEAAAAAAEDERSSETTHSEPQAAEPEPTGSAAPCVALAGLLLALPLVMRMPRAAAAVG